MCNLIWSQQIWRTIQATTLSHNTRTKEAKDKVKAHKAPNT